jgi:hypothetical protein
MRHAGRLLIITVAEPSMTTPGPCGGTGKGVVQVWISVPPAAAALIAELMDARVAALTACSAAYAAGAPGVPAAAEVAASAVFIVASAALFADCNAATASSGIPRQVGSAPQKTLVLPGPPVNTGGSGCITESVNRAANPCGILSSLSLSQ